MATTSLPTSTQPSFSPPPGSCLLDSGVPAYLAHTCDEQRLQPGPVGAVLQEAGSCDRVYTKTWTPTSSSVPPTHPPTHPPVTHDS